MIKDHPNRRSFIQIALITGATLAVASDLAIATPKLALADRIAAYFRALDSANKLGRYYLATLEENPSAAELVTRIIADRSTPESLESLDAKKLNFVISSWIREDFMRSEVRRLDGWTLSRTELEICALAVQLRSENAV